MHSLADRLKPVGRMEIVTQKNAQSDWSPAAPAAKGST
jgi:hypothetical protein